MAIQPDLLIEGILAKWRERAPESGLEIQLVIGFVIEFGEEWSNRNIEKRKFKTWIVARDEEGTELVLDSELHTNLSEALTLLHRRVM